MVHPNPNHVLTITRTVVQYIRVHAEETYPFECCGFLYGDDKSGNRHITLAVRALNSKMGDQRRRFEIAPKDYLQAEQFATSQGLQLLGIYHSHPDHPAVASKHDLAQAMPFFSYLIVSVRNGSAAEMRSWRLRDAVRAFDEEAIHIGGFETLPKGGTIVSH